MHVAPYLGAMKLKLEPRTRSILAAVTSVLTVAILAWRNVWVFRSPPPALPNDPEKVSLWQFILSDRATLGFVRLALIALGIYALASVPALIVSGRWLKGFGTTGLTADDAAAAATRSQAADRDLGEMKQRLQEAIREGEEATERAAQALREKDEALEALRLVREKRRG